MSRRPSPAWLASIVLAVAFLGWTGLVAGGWLDGLDVALHQPGPPPASAAAQVWAAVAITFWPGVVYGALLLLGWWERGHRMTQLALALGLAPAIAWLGTTAWKAVLRRHRPHTTLPELITSRGWSYPSSHAAAATCALVLVVVVLVLTRQRRRTRVVGGVLAGSATVVVLVDRWVLAAHWTSDVVGGALWGALAATLALALARVHVVPARARPGHGRKVAVVFNPVKVGDVETFRRHVGWELSRREWAEPMWLPTTADDPGVAMVATALRKGVDLVLVAGGDGTVNVACAGLAGSGIPLGLLPAGTTNLLARNLGIPLDEAAALETALDGRTGSIDLVRLVPDDDEDRARHSAVMASIGLDANAFAHTSEEAKRVLGPGAYLLAGAQQLGEGFEPFPAEVLVDDESIQRRVAMVAIGNVGFIQHGIEVIPGATPDDGRLDVAVIAPDTLLAWARMLREVLARRRRATDIDNLKGRSVTVTLSAPQQWQVDGDAAGEATVLRADVRPGILRIMLPAR